MSTMLQVNHLKKSYGPRVILDDVTLTITEKQKIGVIGRNGAGKSTLFRIIVGEEEANSGQVQIHDTTRLGYLTQHDPFDFEETVMEFLLRSTHQEEWQCAKMAGKFQIKNEMLHKKIGALAGGYQMRVKLVDLLLHDPNLLLLDEPTNYLDLTTLLLLEQFLQSYRGTFLLISHDREFLKNTCTDTLEIEQGKTTLYPGPIEEYLEYKELQLEMKKKFNKKIEQEKKHLQDFVDRFGAKATKAAQAQSKMKQIAKLKTIDILHPLSTTRIRIPKVEERKGIALSTNHLTIGYGRNDSGNLKTIATDISLDIERGEHVAIVGDNGQGKTTFLKTIAEELPALEGTFRWGPHIKVGYYAQHVPSMLNPIEQVNPYLRRMANPDIKTEQVLEMAGNFLFRDDDLTKPISVLSGGEKARLCLAGLLLQKNQVLLLDEPTNHLDFETVEALAQALQNCNSTILFISHNRTFVNIVATAITEVKNGNVKRYHHNYEEYVWHLEQEIEKESNIVQTPKVEVTEISGDEIKELRSELKKEKKQLHEIEIEIMELEKSKQHLHKWFEKHPTEFSREKTEKLHDIGGVILEKEKEWLKTSEKIAELESKGG